MSFVTATVTEVLYASTAAGASLSSFTTEAQLNTSATMGPSPQIPTNFWLPAPTAVGKGIKILARGTLGTTSSAPTYTVSIRGGAINNITTTPQICVTPAITPAVSLTTAPWRLEADIYLSAIGTGGGLNSTIRVYGEFILAGASSGGTASIYPVYATGTAATTSIQTDTINYLSVNVACGTSNAANTFALNQLEVYGLN